MNEETQEPGPTFDDLGLPEAVLKAVKERGYLSPTPVQSAVYRLAAEGHDCVVQARTGTGKTAAFGLPLVGSRVRARNQACQALVLCPTRELAVQVTRELQSLAQYTELRVTSVYGGAPMQPQIDALRAGAHIVIGTPGRVLDHLKRETFPTQEIRAFILDECDEMLSMGFLPQINDIWKQLPAGHQTLLFSATVPKDVSRIAETRLKDPEFVTLSGDHIGALSIQHFVYISHGNKLNELLQVIEVENPESAIVFCNTKDETKRVAKALQERGFASEWLNADLGQSDRERVMTLTRDSKLRFLVCTDVAARGIDISHLTHVINFDFPDSAEQYVHRTGRTGRAGRMGTAISLVSPTAIGDLYYLRLKYKIHPLERQLPTRQELQTREETDVVASLSLKYSSPDPNHPYRMIARRLLSHDDAESILTGVLEAILGNRSDATQQGKNERRAQVPAARPAPPRTERKPRPDSSGRAEASQASGAPRPGRARDAASPERGPRRAAKGYDEELDIAYEVTDVQSAGAEATGPKPSSARTTTPERRRHPKPVSTPDVAPDRSTDESGGSESGSSGYVSLYLNVGKRDGASAREVVEALSAAGIDEANTGEVVVKARHSYIQVMPDVRERALERLNGMEICGRQAYVEVARPRVSPSPG